MPTLFLESENAPDELRAGLNALQTADPQRMADPKGLRLRFVKAANPEMRKGGLSVRQEKGGLHILYHRRIDAFRALGRILGETSSEIEFSEACHFKTLGAMIDNSRNAVMREETVRAFLRHLALMGLNTLMLYTEDTYEVPGEPFFGYLRGAFSHEELRRLDDYADALGIEIIPCIQTLGHLEQMLQWPAYQEYRDTKGVMLAEDEPGYALLEKMIDAIRSPFRTRRIHIGMDEAHGVGTGRYRRLKGDKPAFDILNAHLRRLVEICKQRGLEPMIWSDMYFRIASPTNEYYDQNAVIPEKIAKQIPSEVQLVYWDYYRYEPDRYEDFIDRHRALGFEPVFATAIWSWHRHWAFHPATTNVLTGAMTACHRKAVDEVFVTIWGDDGHECDLYSTLPGLQLFAEHGFAGTVGPERLRAGFSGSCDADYEAWCRAAHLDLIPKPDGLHADPYPMDWHVPNPSKWLLWQDTLIGLFDREVEDLSLQSRHYADLADDLFAAMKRPGLASRLELPARLAAALSLKTTLRRDLALAYGQGDKTRLAALAGNELPALREAVDNLWKCHRAMWLATYKPWGLEVIEQRYGGLRTRLESLAMTLHDYLSGHIAEIPELATPRWKLFSQPMTQSRILGYTRVSSPSYQPGSSFL